MLNRWVVAMLAVTTVALAACSGSSRSATTGGSATATATPAPAGSPTATGSIVGGSSRSAATGASATATATPAPAGPPTATGSIEGDTNVGGSVKVTSVLCDWPGTNGAGIRLFGQPAGQATGGVALVILVTAQSVNVRAATGSGTTYAQREFNGTGVTNFDAAKGGSINTPLTEDPAAGTHPGTIGAARSINLTIDCSGQQPGTTSLTVSGNTAGGAVTGGVSSARVDCASYAQGLTADVTGLTTVGGKSVLVIVGVTWAGITVAVDGHFYTNSAFTTGTASATGGQWNGDVTDQSTGTTLHVAGDATCGSSTKT